MEKNGCQTELKQFLPICKLGEGAFSTVYKVKRINDSQVYALKKIKLQKLKIKQQQNALNQIRILASIKSKHVVSYKEAFYDSDLGLLCIVMECADGGDMQKQITQKVKCRKVFSEEQIWRAAGHILLGLYVLHEKGILHRDLKSANVFISEGVYMLGDLNVSKVNQEKGEFARTQTGTPYYASPEVWRDQPYNNKCDIWSFGCLLYEMCCLNPPFKGADLDDLYQKVQKGRYSPIPSLYSLQLASLIRNCLIVNPEHRYGTQQLFETFPKLKWIFMENFETHNSSSKQSLINTIKLPYDMRQLSKSLPIAKYDSYNPFKQKNSQKKPFNSGAVNNENPTEKSTHMNSKQKKVSQNKASQINPSIQKALPQRIKDYLKEDKLQNIRKRPHRPASSAKVKQKTKTAPDQRPQSAICRKQQIEIDKEFIKKCQKQRPYTSNIHGSNTKVKSQKRNTHIAKRGQRPEKQEPLKNRCQSLISISSSQKQEKVRRMRSASVNSSKQKTIKIKQQKITKEVENAVNSSKEVLKVAKQNLNRCRQMSIRRMNSLEQKGHYLKNYRKDRKYMFDKALEKSEDRRVTNKQNIKNEDFCRNNRQSGRNLAQHSEIFLDMKGQLNTKIKQKQGLNVRRQNLPSNLHQSQILNSNKSMLPGVGFQAEVVQDKTKLHEKTRVVRVPMNKVSVSADSKRRMISDRTVVQRIENTAKSIKLDEDKYRKAGLIRRIPVDRIPLISNSLERNYSCVQQSNIAKNQRHLNDQSVCPYAQNALKDNILESDEVVRLKKSIKQRINPGLLKAQGRSYLYY